jgi:hypothetical protein
MTCVHALVHLAGNDDSVGPAPGTEPHLPHLSQKQGPSHVGYRCESSYDASRPAPLDLKEKMSCRLTRLHRCNYRLSMNAN